MKTCYTVITNSYDELKDPYVSDGWQYVVFSDRHLDSDVWDCIITEKHNRDIKIRPHLEMFENLTLYVDGSIEIVGNLNEFVSEVPNWFSIWQHPHRQCTFDEAATVISIKGMNSKRVWKQMERYKSLPRNWGLGANGIMLRDLADEKVKQICELWWSEFNRGAPRDQLSLMYCFWSMGYKPDLFDNSIMQKYFNWLSHAR